MNKLITFVAMIFVSVNAFAVDTTRCPELFKSQVSIERVFKSSIYKNVPGWKEAQQSLLATETIESEFALSKKTNNACVYKDTLGNTAVLSTASFQDPEENKPSLVDQVTLNLTIDNSSYVSYIPVENYGTNDIELYYSPFSVKVKAQLYIAKTKKTANLDIGMISVVVK